MDSRYKNMSLAMFAVQGGSFDDFSCTPTPEHVDDADQLTQTFESLSMNEMPGTSSAAQAVTSQLPSCMVFADSLNALPILPENPVAEDESLEDDEYAPNPYQAMYSCYLTESHHNLGFNFTIEIGSKWTLTDTMVAIVWDSQNNQIPFESRREEKSHSHRYICTFRAPAPGYYTVNVRHVTRNFHFVGSPFTVPVIRSYHNFWMQPRPFSNTAVPIKPWGIAYSPLSRKVYVTDRDSHNVIIYNENGTMEKRFGGEGFSANEFNGPTGIAVDNCYNRLVIADTENHRICIYNLDGDFIYAFGRIGHQNVEFNSPWGVAVSPSDGTIAVADTGNHRLQMFSFKGDFIRRYTMLGSPRGVCFDRTGENAYVTDFDFNCMYNVSMELTVRTTLVPPAVNPSQPQGIAVDAVGNILFCDTGNNCIRVVSSTGELLSSIVGSDQSFMHPQDLIVVPTGEIIVVDSNSRICIL